MNTKILCLIVLFVSLTKADEDEEPNLKMDDMIDTLEPFTSNCEPKPKKEHIKEMLLRKKNRQRETKCLLYCLMKGFDMINESETEILVDNSVEVYNLDKQMADNEVKEFAEICAEKAQKHIDKCELAHLFDLCLIENIEKRGFKVPVAEE